MAKAVKKEKRGFFGDRFMELPCGTEGNGQHGKKQRCSYWFEVFLKFAGDKFEKRRQEIIDQYGEIPTFLEKVSFYNAVNVFYLKETARWSYIVKNASANDIAPNSRSGYGGYRGKQSSA